MAWGLSASFSEKSPATITDIAGRANVKANPMASAHASSQCMVSEPLNSSAVSVAAISRCELSDDERSPIAQPMGQDRGPRAEQQGTGELGASDQADHKHRVRQFVG